MASHTDLEKTLKDHELRIERLRQQLSVHDYIVTQTLFMSVGISPDPERALSVLEESLFNQIETINLNPDQKTAATDCAERIFSSVKRTLRESGLSAETIS